VLCDIAKQNSAVVAANYANRFQLQTEYGVRWVSLRSFAKPTIWHSTVSAYQCCV